MNQATTNEPKTPAPAREALCPHCWDWVRVDGGKLITHVDPRDGALCEGNGEPVTLSTRDAQS